MKRIEVVAAIINDVEGRIFATQRGYGDWKGWWEFPGGKIEPGETAGQALKREIHEELSADIDENPHQKAVFHGKLDDVFEKLHGKDLSYNNLLDLEAGLNLIREF